MTLHSLRATIKHKKNKKEGDHNKHVGGNGRAITNQSVEQKKRLRSAGWQSQKTKVTKTRITKSPIITWRKEARRQLGSAAGFYSALVTLRQCWCGKYIFLSLLFVAVDVMLQFHAAEVIRLLLTWHRWTAWLLVCIEMMILCLLPQRLRLCFQYMSCY